MTIKRGREPFAASLKLYLHHHTLHTAMMCPMYNRRHACLLLCIGCAIFGSTGRQPKRLQKLPWFGCKLQLLAVDHGAIYWREWRRGGLWVRGGALWCGRPRNDTGSTLKTTRRWIWKQACLESDKNHDKAKATIGVVVDQGWTFSKREIQFIQEKLEAKTGHARLKLAKICDLIFEENSGMYWVCKEEGFFDNW